MLRSLAFCTGLLAISTPALCQDTRSNLGSIPVSQWTELEKTNVLKYGYIRIVFVHQCQTKSNGKFVTAAQVADADKTRSMLDQFIPGLDKQALFAETTNSFEKEYLELEAEAIKSGTNRDVWLLNMCKGAVQQLSRVKLEVEKLQPSPSQQTSAPGTAELLRVYYILYMTAAKCHERGFAFTKAHMDAIQQAVKIKSDASGLSRAARDELWTSIEVATAPVFAETASKGARAMEQSCASDFRQTMYSIPEAFAGGTGTKNPF